MKTKKSDWGAISMGISFGITSGIITTLGLIIGLDSALSSKLVVLGGILTIAIADAFSDALGIHVSQESENEHSPKEIWKATIATFFAKLIFALTFAIPVLIFPLQTAVMIGVIWGLLVLAILSWVIARHENENPFKVIGEHLFIAVVVIIASHYVGDLIAKFFGG